MAKVKVDVHGVEVEIQVRGKGKGQGGGRPPDKGPPPGHDRRVIVEQGGSFLARAHFFGGGEYAIRHGH